MAATRTITCPVSGGYRMVLGWGMIRHNDTWCSGEVNICEHEDDQGNGAPLLVVITENAEYLSTRDLADVWIEKSGCVWPATGRRFRIVAEQSR